jgi:hypothetical protein
MGDVETLMRVPDGFILGLKRYPLGKRSHLYKGSFSDPGLPMCRYGWTDPWGSSYSIFRGNVGEHGICKICLRRAHAGLEGIPPKEDEDEQHAEADGQAEIARRSGPAV